MYKAMRANNLVIPNIALVPYDITNEAISIPDGAAGSLVDFFIAIKPIIDSKKNWIAGFGDTSIVFTTTAFDNEVSPWTPDAELENGDYWVDYLTGKCRGKKKTTATTGTMNYSVFLSGLAAGGTIFGDLEILGDLKIKAIFNNVTNVNSGSYDVDGEDNILNVSYTATGIVTINIPTVQMLSGRTLTIKDAGGNSTINNITINTEGSEKIDGQNNFIINSNYMSIQLYSDGTNWFVI